MAVEQPRQYMDAEVYRSAAEGATSKKVKESNLVQQTLDNNNILHIAAQFGRSKFIKGVLKKYPKYHNGLLCQSNAKNETPLHLAAQYGHHEAVQALLHAHESVNPTDPHPRRNCLMEMDDLGDKPLHKALRNGHDEVALLLLEPAGIENQALLVSVDNNSGESAAHLAAENKCSKFLDTILKFPKEVVVSFSVPHGRLFLYSARSLPEYLIKMILGVNRGLVPEKKDRGESWADFIKSVVSEDRLSMVKALLEVESSLALVPDEFPLHTAFKMGSFEMVKIILNMSPLSIETRDTNGRTALHNALMEGDFLRRCRTYWDSVIGKRMDLLINQVDKDGNTALHIALLNSKLDAAYQLLLFRGCNWRVRNNDGKNPLDLFRSNMENSVESPVYAKLLDLEGRQRKPILWFDFKSRRFLNEMDLANMGEEEIGKWLDKIGVAAALLLSISFTTSINVPGGYSHTGIPNLHHRFSFLLYTVCNLLAFVVNMTILLVSTLGYRKHRIMKQKLTEFCIRLIQISLLASIFAYGAGYIAISSSTSAWTPWSSILLAVMEGILLICSYYMITQSLITA